MTEQANAVGRPSLYKPEYVEQAAKLCDLGATDQEMADFFGVHVATLNRWKLEFSEFCASIKAAKENADERVERSLYQKATGYDYIEEQAFKIKKAQHVEEVEVVEVRKFNPADTVAAIFWLKNRRREQWRDRHEVFSEVVNYVALMPEKPKTIEAWLTNSDQETKALTKQ